MSDYSHDGLSWIDALSWVVGEEEVDLSVAHEVGSNLCCRAARYAEIVVYLCCHDDIALLVVVVADACHCAYAVTVSIYRA